MPPESSEPLPAMNVLPVNRREDVPNPSLDYPHRLQKLVEDEDSKKKD